MNVPAWLDVALEGGALELQRGLVRYRSLRRLVGGSDWRRRAFDVAELCAATAHSEDQVTKALDRALRRARYDSRAGAATHLAIAVERERRRASLTLAQVSGTDASLSVLLEHVEGLARDESYLESAWRRFHVERVVLTVALAATAALLPAASWWAASWGGDVPTYFALEGLREPFTLPVLLVGTALLIGCRLRLAAWRWLGVAGTATHTGVHCALYAALAVTACFSAIANIVPMICAAFGALLLATLHLCVSLWRVPKAPLLSPLT